MKRALVVGGTRGLGASLVIKLLEKWNVVLATGRSESVEAARDNPRFSGAELATIDLSNPVLASTIMLNLAEMHGPFDYVFWNAGIWLHKYLMVCSNDEIIDMINVHNLSMVLSLREFHSFTKLQPKTRTFPFGHPYHLVVISSTSAYRLRQDEDVYCMVQAGKSAFTRNFGKRIIEDLPGSAVTLVQPAGMDTGFFSGKRDTSMYMDPDRVADIILTRMGVGITKPWDDYRIERDDRGNPIVKEDPALPE